VLAARAGRQAHRLDRHVALELGIAREVHTTHRAGAEQARHGIAADFLGKLL
jgi:hypothetical protein